MNLSPQRSWAASGKAPRESGSRFRRAALQTGSGPRLCPLGQGPVPLWAASSPGCPLGQPWGWGHMATAG